LDATLGYCNGVISSSAMASKKATPYVLGDHGLHSTCGGNSIMVSK